MEWKENKISKLIIYSALGGNCRIRLAEGSKPIRKDLFLAKGENQNPFYKVDTIAAPLLNTTLTPEPPAQPMTHEYDILTKAGMRYQVNFK
jgi:alpha-L-fucosidase 2